MSSNSVADLDDLPEIVGLEVRRYKNLADIWLPWSDGMAVFGVNGVGKTNLLEALALLIGSAQTLSLARSRIEQPAPHDLALLAKVRTTALPWSPDIVLGWPQDMETPPDGAENPFARVFVDAEWWRMLGTTAGSDFWTGLASAAVPSPVRDWLASGHRPASAVRYSLASITRDASPGTARLDKVERLFSRTLLVQAVPDEVQHTVADLPDLFAPLRSYLAAPDPHPDGWVPVLELPPSAEPPGILQWLPHSRTPDEINDDLETAFRTAGGSLAELTGLLGERLPFLTPLGEGDWHWLAHEIAAKEAQAELASTVPQVEVYASGGGDADLAIIAGNDERSHTGDDNVLATLSAGERRWADEALASAARELIRFGHIAGLYSRASAELDDNSLIDAVEHVAGDVEDEVETGGYWSGAAFERLLQALEPHLLAAARDMSEENPVINHLAQTVYPGLTLLEPQVVVRVIDEPEAHLHSLAQRRVAIALDSFRLRGQNVVVASHSPHFLDLPGWGQLHLARTEAGVTLSRIPDDGNSVRTALARDLGVTRGELLAGINAVLIVEGLHDQLVLRSLYDFELKSAGVAVVRMFGTSHLLATAELDFIDEYLDVPVLLLLDNTRVDRVKAGKPTTDEETKLWHLQRRCRQRKRRLLFYGLQAPDVVCYLSEAAIRETEPDFPGWKQVVNEFRRREARGSRPPFKEWLREKYGLDLTKGAQIAAVLATMNAGRHQPVGELTRLVNELVSSVTSRQP